MPDLIAHVQGHPLWAHRQSLLLLAFGLTAKDGSVVVRLVKRKGIA